jgi:thiamine-phosphate pyrophosphorylase
VTPTAFAPEDFAPVLAPARWGEIACLRLALADPDADAVARAADTCREIAHARDVPLVIEKHSGLVERLGLDGVHLTDAARSVRAARKALGADAMVGAACGTSRHDGMAAGEAGADYIAFSPVGDMGLGDDGPRRAGPFRLVERDDRTARGGRGRADPRPDRSLRAGHRFLRHRPRDLAREDPLAALKALTAPLR